MKDNAITVALRSMPPPRTAVQLAELLDTLADSGLNQLSMITCFHRAFPDIPLRMLLKAGGWVRVGNGGLSDAQFNEMLAPWIDVATVEG